MLSQLSRFQALTLNELFWTLLRNQEVDTIFSFPSQTSLTLFEKQSSIGIHSIFLKHEQATVHAADGYARASGKVGVSIVSKGPGVSNAVTSLATTYIDSIPLVLFVLSDSGNRRVSEIVDVAILTMSVSKHNFHISSPAEMELKIAEAFHIAQNDRPGPVVVEISADVMNSNHYQQETLSQALPLKRQAQRKPKVKHHLIKKVVTEILQAKRPILFIGGGVILSSAANEIIKLATTLKLPVVSSLMGLGAFPTTHPLFLGMLGMLGTFASNKAVHRADLLICLGVRFSDRVTGNVRGFSPHSKKIQIDIDPAEINKNIKIDSPIIGDIKEVVLQMLPLIQNRECNEWTNEVSNWKKEVPQFKTTESLLKPQEVIALLDKYSQSKAIITTDVGQHQIWTAHHYSFQFERQLLTSGGLGTMGFGLPASIGAAVAKPAQPIICVSGDGSIQMNIQELSTIVNYQLPIKIAILKNGFLGMVRQWQELFYQSRYSSVKISSPHFVTLAKAYGATGLFAKDKKEAELVIQEAMAIKGPVIMEFDVTEEENVYPMVPPGSNNINTIIKK